MRIVFMGTPTAAACSLCRLIEDDHELAGVYTQPDRPSGRGNRIVYSAVKECAIEKGIPLFQPQKIRTPDASETFRSLRADVAVVVAYGRILPAEFLYAFPHGAVNLHFSLLPKYRGAAPVNWAIVNGEWETGVTTIKMDEGLDTGDILIARSTGIGEGETAPELMERLSVLGADVLSETIARLGEIRPTPQNNDLATFAPVMKREDGLIDWRLRAGEIANRVRGFQPFPGSFTYWNGKKVVIWQGKGLDVESGEVEPGTILSTSGGVLTVAACRGTILEVSEIQFEGKRRISVREALNGVRLEPGERFSSEAHPS